ncbi:hypothetical protein HBI52_191130 [Parastagonospora nodorum]|nr:hypothetical protein HBI52_191130 [Parastagonospora nodorum]
MSQTNVREGYRITILEVVELIEDLISYLLKSLRLLTLKDWLAVAKCIQLRNAQIPKTMMLAKVRQYGAKVKTENLSNTLTLILSETAQRQSSFVVSNRSIASITDKFSVALLTKLAILNNANVALVDAVHYSVVIDALTMTLIKDDDDLLGTVNSYIKLRRLRARCKTEAADSRYAKVSRGRTKKDKDLEDSDTSSDVLRLRRRDRAAAYGLLDSDDYCLDSSSDIDPKDDLEDEEATIAKDLAREQKERLKALLNLIDAYILYFKELLSNNSRIFANAIGIGKTRAIVLAMEVQNARAEGDAIEYNAVNDDNKLCPTKGERTFYCADPLALQFCFFSDFSLENIGRLTKEEAIKMQIDTTDAISKALAAANKLIISEANTPAVHSKATKHCLALLAAQFVIVCSFRKVDKHVFRAYNTISVTAQRTIIRKGGPYIEKRAILLPSHFNATNKRDSVTGDRIYKIEDAQQCRDILEKEGLNKSEASRRVIFNCFEICKVKRFTLNSVKDLFTNLSKDYFLVREARAITKSSLKFQNLLNLCSELAEMCVGIIYFNSDSKLELKVLGKQDVKTTS